MVGCIAENVDALFYRCVNRELAFYLVVLSAFTDAVIYRGVAVTVVPFALGVCRDTRQKCGNRNDNYVNELSFQGKLLSDVLVYNLVELLHQQTQFLVLDVEFHFVDVGYRQNLG